MSSPSSEPIKKRYTLKTSDNEAFDVSEAVALQSNTIKHLIEDGCSTDDVPIPLPNVTAPVLAKVIEFCKKRVESTVPADGKDDWWGDRMKEQQPMTEWDTEFLKVDQNMLFDLILAANYLDIKPLLDLTCKSVADMMRGKTTEQIRERFHIKNDYSPEEEAEVRRENAWAFEILNKDRDLLLSCGVPSVDNEYKELMREWSVAKASIASNPPFLHRDNKIETQYSFPGFDDNDRRIRGIIDNDEVSSNENVPSTLSAKAASTARRSVLRSSLSE